MRQKNFYFVSALAVENHRTLFTDYTLRDNQTTRRILWHCLVKNLLSWRKVTPTGWSTLCRTTGRQDWRNNLTEAVLPKRVPIIIQFCHLVLT